MSTENDVSLKVTLDTDSITKEDIKKIQKVLDKYSVSLDAEVDKSSLDNIKKAFSDISKLGDALGLSFSQGIDKVKDTIAELKKLDSALIKINKALPSLNSSQLAALGKESFSIASRYGKSAADYLSEVQTLASAGYDNASAIAELSLAAQSAGDMTSELAQEYIEAANSAYELEGNVQQLTKVLDGSAGIAVNHKIALAQLAEGMKQTAEAASEAGVTAGEASSALAAILSASDLTGADAGTSFETILKYLQQIPDAEKEITDSGLKEYQSACEALNVSLYETKEGILSLRNPMDILEDLAERYSSLGKNDSRKNSLISSIGGDDIGEALNALLENWSLYEEMLQDYSTGNGALAKEAETSLQTWEGALTRLSNTWTQTISNLTNSDAITTSINAFNSLLSVVNRLTDFLGSAGTIGVGLGAFLGAKNLGRLNVSLISNCFEYALHA